jgi:two-component sensor histidine kinase
MRLPSREDIAPDDWALAHTINNGITIVDELLEIEAFDGKKKIILNYTAPILDNNGTVKGAIIVNQDITDRKDAEEAIKRQLLEKEILLKEVHHRIKNSIASIEGLLSLQAASTQNVELRIALQEVISRVQSTRVLYEKLLLGTDYQEISILDYLEDLVNSLVAVFPESKKVSIEKNIMDFIVSSKNAVLLGIIVNELLTNVFKYAFEGKDEGKVLIDLANKENHITLIIQDNGIGIKKDLSVDKSPRFGLAVVKMLAEQLKGTFVMENDNGARCVLRFEL